MSHTKLPPAPAQALAAVPDPNWQADPETVPIGINPDLWRSLHDLCRIVRGASSEPISHALTAYLSGSFDEVGLKINLAHKVASPLPQHLAPYHDEPGWRQLEDRTREVMELLEEIKRIKSAARATTEDGGAA